MTPGAATLRAFAPRLMEALLARIQVGIADDGFLRLAVRRELQNAHAAGLTGDNAVVAVVALLLAVQAREVGLTLLGLDAKAPDEAAPS